MSTETNPPAPYKVRNMIARAATLLLAAVTLVPLVHEVPAGSVGILQTAVVTWSAILMAYMGVRAYESVNGA